jgi:hypothetical protein
MIHSTPRNSTGNGATVIPPNPSGIPDELKILRRWVAWRNVPSSGRKKPAKLPVNPATGQPADPTGPRTWGPFEAAWRRYHDDRLSGVGFVFAGDEFAGVDLDGCRDPGTGELDPWANAVVSEFGTYAEVSPSGTGVKLIGRGRLDTKGRKRSGPIEVYDHSRFFAVTGRRLVGTPRRVVPCQDALAALQKTLGPAHDVGPPVGPVACGSFGGSDEELMSVAFSAKNGEHVRALWEGDRRRYLSYSEALLALAQHLAFYTGPDEARLERLMLDSPLFARSEAERPKWASARQGGRWGLVYVVRKAISTCPVFYSGPRGVGHNAYTVCVSSADEGDAGAGERARRLSPVQRAWTKVEAGELPPAAMRFTESATRNLTALCWHLSRVRGGRFFLDVRTAGKLLGVPKNTPWRRLRVLVDMGVIRVVRRGRYHQVEEGRRATEFEWLGVEQTGAASRGTPRMATTGTRRRCA